MNQQQRLLSHLKQHGTIRPLEAISLLGIYRLSDTIHKLRKQGYDITTQIVEVKNQFG